MEKIKKLEDLRIQKDKIEKLEREALMPILTKFDDIKIIKEWFDELMEQMNINTPIVEYRQMFLFIVLTLYSPGTLLGDTLIRGLRKKLSDILNISTYSISNSLKQLWFYYSHYKDFQERTDLIYNKILFRINQYFS